jgi:hypothetical protein
LHRVVCFCFSVVDEKKKKKKKKKKSVSVAACVRRPAKDAKSTDAAETRKTGWLLLKGKVREPTGERRTQFPLHTARKALISNSLFYFPIFSVSVFEQVACEIFRVGFVVAVRVLLHR